ncbi:NAD(P)H-binding protein [Streptomyces sp. NPDC097640]|uniref:NAD(P)H-binding protein n=1 Tax=Streptomyces sp. NPDC097640 TaxID=3157229 RepID=UPI00332A19A1
MYFISGATGNIGREIVRLLHAAGRPVRALTRQHGDRGFPEGVEIVRGDIRRDLRPIAEALSGVRGVFLNSDATGPATAEFLRAAHDQGVEHVVLISSVYVRDGVPADEQRDEIARMHRRSEELAEESGLAWTHVRAEEFALNDLLHLVPQIRYGDTVYGPYAHAGTPTVHEHDLAAVAARALLDGAAVHGGTALPVTGPEVLTEPDRVRLLARVTGRMLSHREITPEEGRQHLLRAGISDGIADAVLTELAARTENPAPVSDTVERLVGRPTLSYQDWLSDHQADIDKALKASE